MAFAPATSWIKRSSYSRISRTDAVCIATGAGAPRDLRVPGRQLGGIHLAMDFLTTQNKRLARDPLGGIGGEARDRHVVIIGGGDTGSDCAGTCIRQGARSVRQFELLPQPSLDRSPSTPWPLWAIREGRDAAESIDRWLRRRSQVAPAS